MTDILTGVPPPALKKKFDVVRIVTQEPHQLVVVSKAVFGQPIHWFGRRSHECKIDRGRCKGCEENWPSKWQGYLHVMTPQNNWQGFLEFTATAYELLVTQLKPGENFRGAIIRVGRTKGGPRGRYMIEVLERRIGEDQLPQERDPLQTLRMLWNAKKGPLPEA